LNFSNVTHILKKPTKIDPQLKGHQFWEFNRLCPIGAKMVFVVDPRLGLDFVLKG
jgi:hypothetical protein